MKTCETCRHWGEACDETTEAGDIWGYCKKSEGDDAVAEGYYGGPILTRGNFGCILHEPKDA